MYTNYNKKSNNEDIVFKDIINEIHKEKIKCKVINCKRLNVRKLNTIDSDILTILKVDDEVIMEEKLEDWAYIKTKDGILGYVMDKYIKISR